MSWRDNLKKTIYNKVIPKKGEFFISARRPEWIALSLNDNCDWLWCSAGDLVFDMEDFDVFSYKDFFHDSEIIIIHS